MEQLKAWGISLCCVSAALAVIQFLAPKNGAGRLLEMLCGAVMLFCMLSPLVKVDWHAVFALNTVQTETQQNTVLQEHLLQQLNAPLQQAVAEEGAAALAPYGLTADKIEAVMDIAPESGIYIREITVHLNEQQAIRRVAVKQILEQRFAVDVTIREE